MPEWHVIHLAHDLARTSFDPYGLHLGDTGLLEVSMLDAEGFSVRRHPCVRLSALVANPQGGWDYQFTFVLGGG